MEPERERQLREEAEMSSKVTPERERVWTGPESPQSNAGSVAGSNGSGRYFPGPSAPSASAAGLHLDNVEEVFRYQPWNPDQVDAGNQVRDALVLAAKTILRTVPPSPSRTRALNAVMDARMLANQAISFFGRL